MIWVSSLMKCRVRLNHWYQQDGAPPHWALVVRNHLNSVYQNRWIGRGGPVAWPPRSPDLTPLDFVLWGHVKGRVYETRLGTVEELRDRIENAFRGITPGMLRRVHLNTIERANQCIGQNGQTVQHLFYK
ncbi:uncharacterized protein LOC117650829 [Thrips palmi]|uniref:Uncharacterized protein LOC117650829 n=1 Tax=Thrips palmi TaxID=161013 RepID=A0A6P8ZY43_THRPL|nr:uncharacterized protein LOC117650829 [Thrips palmi]